MSANKKNKMKVIMLGEGRVGKTSLLRRYLTNAFDEGEESTLEAKMHQGVKVEAVDKVWDVFLWDTAGQERFRALAGAYYRDADGAVLTYDITDKDSFTRVRVWLRELEKVVGDNISVMVVGNKCDLERERKVAKREVDDWCAEHNCSHITVSAKLGIRVTEAFQKCVEAVAQRKMAAAAAGGGAATANRAGDVGGDILAGRGPRQPGVRVNLMEDHPQRGGGGGDSGAASSGAGGGSGSSGKSGGGCPCVVQ
jgi:small GTP-binding protein